MCGGRGCFETGVIYEEDETAETGHWLMSCSGLGLSHSHNFQNIEGERNINYEGCQKYPWMVACLLFVTQIMLLILCQFYLNISLILLERSMCGAGHHDDDGYW